MPDNREALDVVCLCLAEALSLSWWSSQPNHICMSATSIAVPSFLHSTLHLARQDCKETFDMLRERNANEETSQRSPDFDEPP